MTYVTTGSNVNQGNPSPFKETILHFTQLSQSDGSVAQAIAFSLLNQPQADDFLTITDGTTTQTFTFKVSASSNFEVSIGSTILATLTNLRSKITAYSLAWYAETTTGIVSINNNVIVIRRLLQTQTSFDDRIFGQFSTPSDAVYVNYNNKLDYNYSVVSQLPSVDPNIKTFGIGKLASTLSLDAMHNSRDNGVTYIWDNNLNLWREFNPNFTANYFYGKLLSSIKILPMETWDALISFSKPHTQDTVTFKSPTIAQQPPFFGEFNFKYVISGIDDVGFTNIQIVDFGRSRGTTQDLVLNDYATLGNRYIFARYEIINSPYIDYAVADSPIKTLETFFLDPN